GAGAAARRPAGPAPLVALDLPRQPAARRAGAGPVAAPPAPRPAARRRPAAARRGGGALVRGARAVHAGALAWPGPRPGPAGLGPAVRRRGRPARGLPRGRAAADHPPAAPPGPGRT